MKKIALIMDGWKRWFTFENQTDRRGSESVHL